MRRLMLSLVTGVSLSALPLIAGPAMAKTDAPACAGCKAPLEKAASNPLRKDDRARDAARHPVETMQFFGVTPSMKVGEFSPGGAWYSRFLGLYLGQSGKLVGLYANPDLGAQNERARASIAAGVAKYPQDLATFTGIPADAFTAMTLKDIPEEQKGTFDRILLARALHGLVASNRADSELRAMRELLKDDGLIGIEQHRAKADAPFAYSSGPKGYLREADVIRLMEINGFELVAKSEINANPKDSANWPDGVWTLPPNLRLKDQDKAKYEAIGESDRMTLLFRKRP